jgi:hypothetical protein
MLVRRSRTSDDVVEVGLDGIYAHQINMFNNVVVLLEEQKHILTFCDSFTESNPNTPIGPFVNFMYPLESSVNMQCKIQDACSFRTQLRLELLLSADLPFSIHRRLGWEFPSVVCCSTTCPCLMTSFPTRRKEGRREGRKEGRKDAKEGCKRR